MEALIIGLVYALMPTLISLLTSAAISCMLVIMDDRLFKFSAGSNVFSILEDLFVSGNNSHLFDYIKIDLGNFIFDIGIAFIFIIMVIQIISSYLTSLEGEESESPFKIVARALVTFLIEVLIFGVPNGAVFQRHGGLLVEFGNLMAGLLSVITDGFSDINQAWKSINLSLAIDPAQQVVLMVFSFALFKGVIEAGIVFVERWLSFAFNVLFGPIFVSFNASKKTSETFRSWIMTLVSQALTIFFSYIILMMFCSREAHLSGISLGDASNITKSIFPNLLFDYAVAMALLALYKNSEKLLNAVGLRTIANGDTLRDYMKGVSSMASLWRNTGGTLVYSFTREIGKKVAGDTTHAAFLAARDKYGENSKITKAAEHIDTKKDKEYIKSDKLPQYKDGKYNVDNLEKTRMSDNQREELNKSVTRVNEAMKSDVGKPVSMKDVSKVNGLDQLSDRKYGSTAIIGEIERPKLDEFGKTVRNSDGSEATETLKAQVFRGTRVSNGYEDNPHTKAIIPGDKPLEPGSFVKVDNSEMNMPTYYRISNSMPERTANGYMYDLNDKPLNREEFNSNPIINKKYEVEDSDGKVSIDYNAYRENHRTESAALNARLDADGYASSWQYGADEKIEAQMFGNKAAIDRSRDAVSVNSTVNQRLQSWEEFFNDQNQTRKDIIRTAEEERQLNVQEQKAQSSNPGKTKDGNNKKRKKK